MQSFDANKPKLRLCPERNIIALLFPITHCLHLLWPHFKCFDGNGIILHIKVWYFYKISNAFLINWHLNWNTAIIRHRLKKEHLNIWSYKFFILIRIFWCNLLHHISYLFFVCKNLVLFTNLCLWELQLQRASNVGVNTTLEDGSAFRFCFGPSGFRMYHHITFVYALFMM